MTTSRVFRAHRLPSRLPQAGRSSKLWTWSSPATADPLSKAWQPTSLMASGSKNSSTCFSTRKLTSNCQLTELLMRAATTGTRSMLLFASTISNSSSFWSPVLCARSPLLRKLPLLRLWLACWSAPKAHSSNLISTRQLLRRLLTLWASNCKRSPRQSWTKITWTRK